MRTYKKRSDRNNTRLDALLRDVRDGENLESQGVARRRISDSFWYFGSILQQGMPDWRKKHVTNTVIEHRVQSTQLTHGPSIWVDDGGHVCKYVKHFIAHTKPSKERPVVLLLDKHDSHLSIEALEYCRQTGVTVLSFPPQCKHKLQPLDISVCGHLRRT